MDEIDLANQELEFLERVQRSKQYKQEAEPTGYCLFCFEPLDDKRKRWCDAECRDAWEKEQKKGVKR